MIRSMEISSGNTAQESVGTGTRFSKLEKRVFARMRQTDAQVEETARWLTEQQTFSFMKILNTRLNWKFLRSSFGPVLIYPGKVYEAVEKLEAVGWSKIERQTRATRFVLSRKGKFPIMVWWNGQYSEVMAIGIDKSVP